MASLELHCVAFFQLIFKFHLPIYLEEDIMELSLGTPQNVLFQQDSAPPDIGQISTNFLNKQFPNEYPSGFYV